MIMKNFRCLIFLGFLLSTTIAADEANDELYFMNPGSMMNPGEMMNPGSMMNPGEMMNPGNMMNGGNPMNMMMQWMQGMQRNVNFMMHDFKSMHNKMSTMMNDLAKMQKASKTDFLPVFETLKSKLEQGQELSESQHTKFLDEIGQMQEKLGLLLMRNPGFSGESGEPAHVIKLISPMEGAYVSSQRPPFFKTDQVHQKFILFASKNDNFSKDDTLQLLISSDEQLVKYWERIVQHADKDQIYLAVQALFNNGSTSLRSNGVMVYID